MIGRADCRHGLYILSDSGASVVASFSATIGSVSISTWHHRLSHLSSKRLALIKDTLHIKESFSNSKSCTVCPLAKQKKLSFSSNNHVALNTFDIIHADIWGPLSTSTYNGYRYFLTLVDDASCFTWVYLPRHKSDVLGIIPSFFKMVATQFSKNIKCFRSDNAPELRFTEFFASIGTIH